MDQERRANRGREKIISATNSNTSSSISYEFAEKTESIHIRALGHLTRKIDQILFKIQSMKDIRTTLIGSDANLNKASDYSIGSKVEDVYSKGSIFNNLDSIDNEIGNAHLEMEGLLDELKKSKDVLKFEHFEIKKQVVQKKSSNCKRKLMRKMVESVSKFHVNIHRQPRRLKYRKTNKSTRKLMNRISVILSKMPLLKNMFCRDKLLKANELEYNFKHVLIGDSQKKTEELTDMTLSNDDNEIIVLFKRPNMFNDVLLYNDNEYNRAEIPCAHDNKESSSDQYKNKKNKCLRSEIGMRFRTVSDPMIRNYEGMMQIRYEKPCFNQFKIMPSQRMSSEENQQKYRSTSNIHIDVNRCHGKEVKNFQNNKIQMNLCTSATQTIQSENTVDQTLASLKDSVRKNPKSKVIDSNINQESSSILDKIKYSKRVSSEVNFTSAGFIREPGDRNITHKPRAAGTTIEFSPFAMKIENDCQGSKYYGGLKTGTEYNLMSVFQINIRDEKRLKPKYEETLLKYTFSFIDLKNKSKLSRRVVHYIKRCAKRICEKYHESFKKHLSRILENASLSYISQSLIFKYSNIINTKEIPSKKYLEYCEVSLFGGKDSSYQHLIRKKKFQNKTKEHYHQRNKLNKIIAVEKRNPSHQIYKLKMNNPLKYISRGNTFTANNFFKEENSTEAGINFVSSRPKEIQHTKYTEPLENDKNITKGDNIFKEISNLVKEVNTLRRLMDIDFERNFYNHKRNSKRISQLILKNNSNVRTIINRFKMLNGRMKAISMKQAENQEFMMRYITRSKIKNRMQESNYKNLSKRFRRLKDVIRFERRFPKEKFKNTINEQNNKFTHFHSELNKLNKIIRKIEDHLTVYMHAIKILKECVKFNSNKIENVDYVANLNANQQHLISNKLNDIESDINNIDNAVQSSITSLEEDIYTNRYLIKTGAKIIDDKVKMQNEINEKLDEQMKKQDSDVGILLTSILELKKQMDETTVERQRTQSMTRKLDERNPQTQDLLKLVKEKISKQIQINRELDTILQQHERRYSHFEKIVNLNLKAQHEINDAVIENYKFLEKEIHCLKVYTQNQNSVTIRSCKEINYLKKRMNELLQCKTSDNMNSRSGICSSQKHIIEGKKRLQRQLDKSTKTKSRKLNKIIIVLVSICLTSYVVTLSLSFDFESITF